MALQPTILHLPRGKTPGCIQIQRCGGLRGWNILEWQVSMVDLRVIVGSFCIECTRDIGIPFRKVAVITHVDSSTANHEDRQIEGSSDSSEVFAKIPPSRTSA